MEKVAEIHPASEVVENELALEKLKREMEELKDRFPEIASFQTEDLENLGARKARLESFLADIAKGADIDHEKAWRSKMKREIKGRFLKENQVKTEQEIDKYVTKTGLRKVIVTRDILLNPEKYLGKEELDELSEIQRLIEYFDAAISYLNKLLEIEELEK